MSELISRDGADTSSYMQRDTRSGRSIDPSTSPRDLMQDALVSEAPAPDESERPGSVPEITPEIVAENLRRVKAGAANTLVTIHPDGTRSYKEDRVFRGGDGLQDTVTHGLRTDRGEGTTESLDMLSKEGKVRVDGLLPGQKRDSTGKFRK